MQPALGIDYEIKPQGTVVMDWSGETIATITVGTAILAFLWNPHRDMAALRERMAHLGGTVSVLAKVMVDHRQDRG